MADQWPPRVVLASLSGVSDAEWARAGAPYADAAILGGIALCDRSREAARSMVADRDRTEFLPEDPIAFLDRELARAEDNGSHHAPLKLGFNLRSTRIEPLSAAAAVCAEHDAVAEINAHCRQEELCAVGCGEALLSDTDRLRTFVETAAAAGATVSVKVRAEVPGVDLAATALAVADSGGDVIHVDAMDSESVVADVTAAAPELMVIANNGVRDAKTATTYLDYGADAVSVGRPSDDLAVLRRVRRATDDWFRQRSANPVCDGGSSTGPAAGGQQCIPTERTALENAQLALLLEVAGTPTPGCVDRAREYHDLRFEHFLAGTVGAYRGLSLAAAGEPVGTSFERAVRGMSRQRGGNTHFGAVLLVVPLLAATERGSCTPNGVRAVVESTTVDDAVQFYRAFEHVDVFVSDPPAEATALDVRRGSDAIGALRERDVTLYDVMRMGADSDDDAREWTSGFPRSFRMADRLAEGAVGSRGITTDDSGAGAVPLTDRAAGAFLDALAERPDTLVAKKHGMETARRVSDRAATLRGADRPSIEEWAGELVERGINPGTTADILAAGLFIALHREDVTV